MLEIIDLLQGIEDASVEIQLQAWQKAVDTGLVWTLEGWYARTASLLIDQELISPASPR